MARFLSKLFKPKWQSSTTSTRIAAVTELTPSSIEDKAVLIKLIKEDSAPEVRHAAINRLDDTELLCDLIRTAKAEDQSLITQKMLGLAQQLGLSLYDLIEDRALLASIIVHSDNNEAFINGLARIENEDALFTIASEGRSSKIRQAATELIETEEKLVALNEAAKGRDKRVLQITKSKLQTIREHQKREIDLKTKIEALLAGIAEHSNTDNTTMYASKLDSLLQRWAPVSEFASGEQIVKWNEFLSKCKTRIETLNEQSAESKEPDIDTNNDEQMATLELLEQTLAQLKAKASSYQELHALDALIKTQETRWIEASRNVALNKQLEKQFSQLMGQMRNYLKTLQSVQANEDALHKALEQTNELKGNSSQMKEVQALLSRLTKLYQDINWPIGFTAPEIIQRTADAIGQSEELKQSLIENSEQLLTTFEKIIAQLDASIEERQLKQSRNLLKKAQLTASQLDAKLGKKVAQALALRSSQVQSLKDWQGFASAPRQNELCEAMEALTEQHISPELKATKIKEMQQEWRSLGGAADQSLWERFKTAADKAFEPCAEYFQAQNGLKESNLERRNTIISQLSAFEDNHDWASADWKAIENISRQAKNEWREAYPVDHKLNKPLQEQFNKLIKLIDKRLSEQKQANMKLKANIVERAQALSEENDLSVAMGSAKSLQAEWQKIGITQHGKDRALWKEFRAACDAIFAKRDQAREQEQTENAELRTAAEELCTAIKTSANDTAIAEASHVDELISDFRKRFKNLGELPRKQREVIQNQYEQAMHELKDKAQNLRHKAVLQQWQEAARKAQTLSTAAHTKDAEELAQLESEFSSKVALDKALEAEFAKAWKSLSQQAKKEPASEADVRELCIRCEIAAGLDSPESESERRMQLQVSRLSEGLSSSKNQSREEQLTELLTQWYTNASYTESMRADLEPRIMRACKAIFAPQSKTAAEKNSPRLEGA
jgi:DNA repair protein SbcC/Rad50